MKVYLAGPIDLVGASGSETQQLVHSWRLHARQYLRSAGHNIFDPSVAYGVDAIERIGPSAIWASNQAQIDDADAVLALLPPSVRTIGTPMEIEYARASNKPLVVVCEDRSFQLLGAGVKQYDFEDLSIAMANLAHQAVEKGPAFPLAPGGAALAIEYSIADPALQLVSDELERAFKLHGTVNSPHEGYAVLLEEVDELWAEIKNDRVPDGRLDRIRAEAVQVAAMAIRLIVDCA